MENLDLAYSMFNQYLYQDAKNNITHLEYYFTTNFSTQNNPLIKEFIYAIKTYPLESIDLPLFQSIMTKHGKTQAESDKIIGEIIKWKQYSKDQVAPAKKHLQDICASSIINRANQLHKDSPADFMKYLKTVNFKTSSNDYLKSIGFSEVDINTLIADSGTDGIPSHYSWLNNCFEPDYKLERSQMIMCSMAPGCGKSLYAMSEALNMAMAGYKVHYFAMGDLNQKDFIVRMGAMYSGMTFGDTKRNLGTIYKGMSEAIGDNLGLTIVPAGQVTVDQYIDFIKDQPYEVLFIDYDSNFLMPGGDNMYSEYGEVYSKLTELTMMEKIVFILAQPKVSAWGNEVIELNEVGESSRKQHTADIILTRGRVVGCPNNLGCFKVVKNRRGETGDVVYTIRLNNGRFKEIPRNVFDTLKTEKEKKNYTESEIDGMINVHNINSSRLNQQINRATMAASASQQYNPGTGMMTGYQGGPSPF